MKVAFIHDHHLNEIPDGGAQITTAELIRCCPFDITFLNPKTIDFHDLQSFSKLIISNCKFFNDEQMNRILAHPCFIKFERDFYNLANIGHGRFRKMLFEQSARNIFLSPLHYERFKEIHKDIEWEDAKVSLHHVPVDIKKFNPRGLPRRNVYAFVGALVSHKGIDNLFSIANQLPEITIEVYGRGFPEYEELICKYPNMAYMGMVPYDDMPSIYNNVKGFIFLPSEIEPFGRVVAEARLCGCEMVLNEKVGAKSYEWFWEYDEFWEKMRTAGETFWELIKEI